MRITTSARSACAALGASTVLATALVGLSPAPADAAAGVVGRLDSVSARYGESCFQKPRNEYNCNAYTYLHIAGWALNKKTAPLQQVRVVVTGTLYTFDNRDHAAGKWVSSAYTAGGCRNDVKRVYKLKSCAVGYSASPTISLVGHFVGTIKVCAQARDKGSSQAWRAIGTCKTTKVATGGPKPQ